MSDGPDNGREARGRRRQRPPLDEASLRDLAMRYVARFATSRAKLATYLSRKVRERGWSGAGEPDFSALAERIAELGLIDDATFAGMKAASLTRRGYGKGRVRAALAASGIGAEDGSAALAEADAHALDAALRFAAKRRIGPFAAQSPDRAAQERALAAMLRAGHAMSVARRLVALPPGDLGEFGTEHNT